MFINSKNITKMKKFRFFLSCLTLAAFVIMAAGSKSSVHTYYQVYGLETDNLTKQDNLLVYSNNDCNIKYCMWAEGGSLSFVFENKTDKDLYFLAQASHLIQNGFALEYYDPNEYTTSITTSSARTDGSRATLYGFAAVSGSFLPANVSKAATVTSAMSSTNSVKTVSQKAICIPAHSSKIINGFSISNSLHLDCEATPNNFPEIQSPTINFTQDRTPLSMCNIITYSTDPEGQNASQIKNNIWVKSITNFSAKGITNTSQKIDCTTGYKYSSTTLEILGADKYYNSYNKNTPRGTKNK